MQNDPLKKIRPIYDKIKAKCLDLYQPLRELLVDERMVKSKARSSFRQYIRNKPTKWGFKFWVVADPTGYNLDFNFYCGKHYTVPLSSHGLSHDAVMELIQPFCNQGYLLFFDNFYTSPQLMAVLKGKGIGATGTLRLSHSGVPDAVKTLAQSLNGRNVPRGTGYYICEQRSQNVYCCWQDNQCVTVLSTCYPGHIDSTARRRSKDQSGSYVAIDVPLPSAIKHYNQSMGGLDLSDQLIGYHLVLRQTKRYWKTLLYHLIEVSLTNAFVLYKWQCAGNSQKPSTENSFRDSLVLAIIEYCTSRPCCTDSYCVQHGSTAFDFRARRWCAVRHLQTSRQCPDCPFSPALCQSSQ